MGWSGGTEQWVAIGAVALGVVFLFFRLVYLEAYYSARILTLWKVLTDHFEKEE